MTVSMSELVEQLAADASTLYAIAARWEGRGFTLSDGLYSTMEHEGIGGDGHADSGHARDDLCRHVDALHRQSSAAHRAAVAAAELVAQVRLLALEARRDADEQTARRRMLLHRIGRTTL